MPDKAINPINHLQKKYSIPENKTSKPTTWNNMKVRFEDDSRRYFASNSTDKATPLNLSLLGNVKHKEINSNQTTFLETDSTRKLTAEQNKNNIRIFLAEIVDHMSTFIDTPENLFKYIDIRRLSSKIEVEILDYCIKKGYSSSKLEIKMESLKKKYASKGLYHFLSKLTEKLINHPNKYLDNKPPSQTQQDVDWHKDKSITETKKTKDISAFKINISRAYMCLPPNKQAFIRQNNFTTAVDFFYNDIHLPIDEACKKAVEIANKSRTLYELHSSFITFTRQNQHLLSDNIQKDKITSNHIQQTTEIPELVEETREIPAIENISLSPMTNLGNTCWCNSGFKFMLHYYGLDIIKEAIEKKISVCDTNTITGIHRVQVLEQLDIIFTDLSNNKPISNQINNFFIAINNYIQDAETLSIEEDFIEDISQFIKVAFQTDDKKPDFAKIQQEDPEHFFLHLSSLLGLFNDYNKILYKKIKQVTFSSSDLKAIGIPFENEKLTFDIELPADDAFMIVMGKEGEKETANSEKITVKLFIDYLNRATNTEFSKQELLNIASYAERCNENIEISCEYAFKETAPIVNMEKFSDFVVHVDRYRHNSNGETVRDTDKIKSFVAQIFQKTQMVVIDKNTNEQHAINTQPSTLIMRQGTGFYGHYMTISIDSRQNFWVQNDRDNDSMENVFINTVVDHDKGRALAYFRSKSPLDQLLIFMHRMQLYPISIGCFVV
jgi:hypothetical protein